MNLSNTADDLRLSRIALQSGQLPDSATNDLNNRLLLDPFDLCSRTRLLAHYNRVLRQSHEISSESAKVRAEHILWFVDNIPDSKFCGESECYLHPSDYGYPLLKETWLRKMEHSDSLMRRVNAFLLFINSKEPGLMAKFEEFFRDYRDSNWARALNSHLELSDSWQEAVIEALNRSYDLKAELFIHSEAVQDSGKLNRLAATASASASKLELGLALNSLATCPEDMKARALVLGYTFSSYLSSSALGFEAELAALRFEQMSWLLRYAPSSEFASHAFAMDPLDELSRLNEEIAIQWSIRVKARSLDEQLLTNAAIFCTKLSTCPSAKLISEQLNKTLAGKRILARISSRY